MLRFVFALAIVLLPIVPALAQSRPPADPTLRALDADMQALNQSLAAAQQSLDASAAMINETMARMREREAAKAAWWAGVWRALSRQGRGRR